VVTAALVIAGSERSVVPNYRAAALVWLHGYALYSGEGAGFLYLPQAAILFTPFAVLPPVLGGLLWRAFTIGVFALGIYRFAQLANRDAECALFPLATLIALPLAWDCARNGQSTMPLAGLMLLSIVDVADGRWWRATMWLSLALAIKPLAIVLTLLVMALERPMRWRLIAGTALVAVAPFLTQRPEYVMQQYSACVQSLRTTAHVGVVELWAQPFSVLRLVGVDIVEHTQTAIRVAAAVVSLLLCWLAHRHLGASRYGVYLYAIAATYLMLSNPRTENNTYAMLGPAIGVFFAEACVVRRQYAHAVLLLALAAGTVGSYEIGRRIVPQVEAIWLAPLMAVCFAAYLVITRPGIVSARATSSTE
jgi:hypothetical protein